MNLYAQIFAWTYAFISCGETPRMGINKSYGKYVCITKC